MSDINTRKLLADSRANLAANIQKHKGQLDLLKQSFVLAEKLGEDTTQATSMIGTLEKLLDVMDKQLKTEMK